MANLDLDAIRKRCEKATPGPWRLRMHGGTQQECPEPPEYTVETPSGHILAGDAYPGDGSDVEFIAHARVDIPALLAEIERLRSQVSEPTDEQIRDAAEVDSEESWGEVTEAQAFFRGAKWVIAIRRRGEVSEPTAAVTDELQALAPKWNREAAQSFANGNDQWALALQGCADELEAALGREP